MLITFWKRECEASDCEQIATELELPLLRWIDGMRKSNAAYCNRGKCREGVGVGETDFVDKISRASIAYSYSYDRLGILRDTAQNGSNYHKILWSSDWKSNPDIFPPFSLENSRLAYV
jgi:hypothetical protein